MSYNKLKNSHPDHNHAAHLKMKNVDSDLTN